IEAPPAAMRSTYSVSGDCVTFVIPPEKFDIGLFFPMLIPVAGMMALGTLFLFSGRSTNFPGHWVLVAILGSFFFVLPIVWLVGYVISRRELGGVVEASPDQLRVTCKRLLGEQTKVITSDELQELRIETEPTRRTASARHLLEADSDKEFVLFGHGLPREELEW